MSRNVHHTASYQKINKDELISIASASPDALLDLFSAHQLEFKLVGNTYVCRQSGGLKIYRHRNGTWLVANHSGKLLDGAQGSIWTIAKQLGKIDTSTRDGFLACARKVAYHSRQEIISSEVYVPPIALPTVTKTYIPNNSGKNSTPKWTYQCAPADSDVAAAFEQHFLKKTGATADTLRKYGVKPLLHKTNRKGLTIHSTAQNLEFIYQSEGANFNTKTKRPYAQKQQYKNGWIRSTGNYLFGWSQLPNITLDLTLIITGGEDDALCLNQHFNEIGIYAIAIGSEMSNIDAGFLTTLRARFKAVYTMFDNDKAGQAGMQKQLNTHGLPCINIANHVNSDHFKTNYHFKANINTDLNDICDIYQHLGADYLQNIIFLETVGGYHLGLKEEQKLTVHAQLILQICQAQKADDKAFKIDLESGCNSGKSTVITRTIAPKIAQAHRAKSLIILPLNMKVSADSVFHGLPAVTGEHLKQCGNVDTYLAQVCLSDTILVNHNMLPVVAKHIREKLQQDYFAFIDESQTIVTGTYKPHAIDELMMEVETYAKGIFLYSGTPKPYFAQLGYTPVKVSQINLPTIHVVHRTVEKIEESALAHLPAANSAAWKEKIVCMKFASKQKIKDLKKLLISTKGFKSKEIVVVYSNPKIKKTRPYQRIIRADRAEGSFSDAVKIVLCTSAINEGIDLYSNKTIEFVSFERFAAFDEDNLVQYPYRHRTQEDKTLYLYTPKSDLEAYEYDEIAEFKQLNQYWQRKALAETDRRKAEIRSISSLQLSDTAKHRLINDYSFDEKYLYFDSLTQSYQVKYWRLMAFCEAEKIRKSNAASCIERLLSKHSNFTLVEENTPAPTMEVSEATTAAIATQKEQTRAERAAVKLAICTLLQNDKYNFLQAVRRLTEDVQIVKQIPKTAPTGYDPAQQLIEQNPLVFEDHFDIAEKAARHYLGLLAEGLSELETVAMLTQGNKLTSPQKIRKFINSLRLHRLNTLYSSHKEELSRQQRRDGKRHQQCIKAFMELMYGEGITNFNSKKILAVIQCIYGRTNIRSQGVAVELFNRLFVTKRSGNRTGYNILKVRTLEEFIDGQLSVQDPENGLKVYLNSITPEKRLTC